MNAWKNADDMLVIPWKCPEECLGNLCFLILFLLSLLHNKMSGHEVTDYC